jgi:glycine reductase
MISKELEKAGVTTALISAIPTIPLAAGVSRVVRGVRVEHVCGDPRLSAENDAQVATRIVENALEALNTDVAEPTLFDSAAVS